MTQGLFYILDVAGGRQGLTLQELEQICAPMPLSAPSIADVKAECRRRILLIMTEDQQRNALAAGQAAMMEHGVDPATWPPELQDRQSVALAAWQEISRLRARSNEIEAMDPVPDGNYLGSDETWSS